jgi:hypothetical protein
LKLKKLPKVNNHPMGKYSPNLVTLLFSKPRGSGALRSEIYFFKVFFFAPSPQLNLSLHFMLHWNQSQSDLHRNPFVNQDNERREKKFVYFVECF